MLVWLTEFERTAMHACVCANHGEFLLSKQYPGNYTGETTG